MRVSALADRATWEPYPLSVGTALALLGGMGNHPDHPLVTQPLLDYDEVWVNLKTLFRNLYTAVDRNQVATVTPQAFAETLQEEIAMFADIVSQLSEDRIKTRWYVCDYKGMERAYPQALLRGDTTDLQKRFTSAMKDTLLLVLPQHKDVAIYPLKITQPTEKKVLLLTHYAVDLFSDKVKKRALFESHTGAIKEKHQWYTKYLSGNELPMIPFTEALIQVFGDKEHFRPMSMAVKKVVLGLADKYTWSQVTTALKIRYSIEQLTDPAMRQLLLSLL